MTELKKFLIKSKNIFLGFFILRDFYEFKKRNENQRFALSWKDFYPCISDKTENTGFNRHYIFHPAWAARVVADIKPKVHIDISSTLSFCSIVSAFVPVRFYDYRPADLQLSGLTSGHADLLALPFANNSIHSLSCMHTIEHVGLGRYGDPIDPEGDLKAIKELRRVLAPGGSLLFVVPMGRPKIRFNAHRIYSYEMILDYFPDLTLKEFALIPENENDGGLVYNPSKNLINKQEENGCGCFWFVK